MSNYNGWKNYETWNCSLHIMSAFDGETSKVSADAVEDMVCEYVGKLDAGSLLQDIVEAYIREVDFEEIADAINEANEIEDETEEEDEG
jgi:hypothetical protein